MKPRRTHYTNPPSSLRRMSSAAQNTRCLKNWIANWCCGKTQPPYQKAQVLERVGGQRRRTFYQALHLSHKPVQVGECCFPIPHAFVPWAGNRTHYSAITKRHSPFRVYPVRVPILSSRDLKLLSQTSDAVLRTAFISAFHSITLSTTIMGRCSEPNQEKGEDLRTRSRMITNDSSTIYQDRASARL